jgi:LacI family transcriptional regulator
LKTAQDELGSHELAPASDSKRKTVAIREVARHAGVSVTTVSHVVSGNRPVREATAARVRQAMKDLDYVPNHAAKSLRSGSTHTISLLVPDISNSYFAELAKGAEDAAEAEGFNLVLCNTDFNAQREERYFSVVRGGAFDGLIYVAGARPLRRSLHDLARSLPIVLADEEQEDLRATTVVSDNFTGGLLAGKHLRELGHRDALYIGGPEALATTVRRLEGFTQALEDGSVRVAAYGDYREQAGYDAVRAELLREPKPSFTAVFAGNDLMAIGAIRALGEAGLPVPKRVSVVGYDDIHLAALVTPSLTTVRQPVYGIGQAAAEQLILQIRKGEQARHARHVLGVELIVRASTSSVSGLGAA